MYVVAQGSQFLINRYRKLEKATKKKDFRLLDQLHHLSCGMKAVYSQICHDCIRDCIQSIGGAGFSAWSGLPILLDNQSASVTLEGDNTVLLQQCFNQLFRMTRAAVESDSYFSGVFGYLNEIKQFSTYKCTASKPEHFL
mmetsp:Transcript_29542/g.45008  ORF Transcript_29542/g.45008 Transcript_29542/m.45008 type:complete len:140 (+) Transcript_29542:1065-1484(+)